jgi:hypothetical protein
MEGRALGELGALAAVYPLLSLTPRGDAHPVLVLPGLGGGDLSTLALRIFLRRRGYESHGWKQGINLGPIKGMAERLRDHFVAIHERHGRKVSVIGWSLGGIYARELAKVYPDAVRQVITLCSPFVHPGVSHAAGARYRIHEAPPVPTTAIYSRTDGIVAWQGCVEKAGPRAENIEIDASHCGIGHHPLALYAIADRLAQPEREWRPFDRSGLRRLVYPAPSC